MAVNISGAPTSKTPGKIGDHLVDSTTGKVYECISVNTYGGHDAVTFKRKKKEYVWKCIGDDPNYGQADWNQNDDTQPDYVKNRPFYTGDPVETVLVEESTVTFEDAGGLYMALLQNTFEVTEDMVGETWKISWDGTVYECPCVEADGKLAVGNLSIVGVGSDTGEPFVIGINVEGFRIFTADTSASHTFSISRTAIPVVKIDERYLPSTIPFMKDGKIPEKYVQERFPDASDIFGGILVNPMRESTLANPYPNKNTLPRLTVEAFNVMFDDQYSRPSYVMVGNNVAAVTISPIDPSAISVSWSDCVTYGRPGKPLAGAKVRAFYAKIHEDTDNPGTMVSECAVVTVASKALT